MASCPVQPQAHTSPNSAKTQSQPQSYGQTDLQPAGVSKHKIPTRTISLAPSRHLFLHLQPITDPPNASPESVVLDETTLRLHLLAATSKYLGDTGAAIPVDILSVRRSEQAPTTAQLRIVVRVPREDGPAFMAAIASWVGSRGGGSARGSTAGAAVVGYTVRAKSEWLAELLGSLDGDVDALFDFTR